MPRGLLALIGATLLGVFLVQMDSTMVNIALESLGHDLHAGLGTIQWVGTVYLLALAAMIPVAGWAVDRLGDRASWLTALALFTAGSLLCGLAWSAPALIAARGVQGIGGGLLLPLFQTIVTRRAGGRQLGQVMALIGVPLLLGPVVGPVLGGLLVDGPGWRWIFLVNLPICAAAAWAAVRVMPAGVTQPARLDLVGLLLLSPALVTIVWGLSSRSAPLALAGLVLLAAFVAHALRTPAPAVDLRLFRGRDFTAATILMFLAMVALLGTILLIPLYYQQVHGLTPLEAGLLLAPNGAGSALSLRYAGRFIDRFGVRPVALTGAALLLAVALAFTRLTATTSPWVLAALVAAGGLGFGAVLVPAQSAIFSNLPRPSVPHATTAVRVFQQIGASFGVALLATSLQRAALTRPLSAAFAHTFWWTAAASALALVPALMFRRRRDRVPA
ncbi:MDR family MFS transporter [Paractinoplanes atraurantiacus]|uniref:Drug resistance transporter, EmrB/QacA subfamily n=1 Tax=Paractinoplanes atraurantiacus TaxID=1036182 RepID=A0A285K3Z3_9ACTN|nr:MDR family MFS transporter [Actinoplanes atraurantiacus]SNY67310.1 drug resistance transporter, EmrB/QacA subfamily [Actinoplanes atraurantiacus]